MLCGALVIGNAEPGHARVVVLVVPADSMLCVDWLLHAGHKAEVVEKRDELVRAAVVKTVAALILDERNLRVDALDDRRGRGLRFHQARDIGKR